MTVIALLVKTIIFTPDGMHSTFYMVDQIMKDLGDISINLKTIALRAHVSIPTVELYADSYLRIPRQFLPEYLGIDELYSDMALKIVLTYVSWSIIKLVF